MFNSLIVQKHNQVRTKSKTTHIPKIIFIIDALVFKVLFSLCLIKLVDFSGFIIVGDIWENVRTNRTKVELFSAEVQSHILCF